jgi:hypothetical protein
MSIKHRSVFWIVCFVMTLALAFAVPRLASSQETLIAQCMGGGMMGGGMNRSMMGGGMMQGDMQLVHQLFADRSLIRRTVEEIPGGIRAVTESDDPQVAALIQQHVTSMYQRVEGGQEFSMMSSTLPIMFANADRYQRELETTPKGVAITETSDDPHMAAVIRSHGREVSDFVDYGMSAMCGMM